MMEGGVVVAKIIPVMSLEKKFVCLFVQFVCLFVCLFVCFIVLPERFASR